MAFDLPPKRPPLSNVSVSWAIRLTPDDLLKIELAAAASNYRPTAWAREVLRRAAAEALGDGPGAPEVVPLDTVTGRVGSGSGLERETARAKPIRRKGRAGAR